MNDQMRHENGKKGASRRKCDMTERVTMESRRRLCFRRECSGEFSYEHKNDKHTYKSRREQIMDDAV
jgi:hypothetical protein